MGSGRAVQSAAGAWLGRRWPTLLLALMLASFAIGPQWVLARALPYRLLVFAIPLQQLALIVCHFGHGVHGLAFASNDTGRATSPRSPRFWRHASGPGSSARPGSRRSSVENAICPSIRASGAPKQDGPGSLSLHCPARTGMPRTAMSMPGTAPAATQRR